MKSAIKWSLSLIIIISSIVLIGNYTRIHTDKIVAVQIDEKIQEKDSYFIMIDGEEFIVENENTWNLIDKANLYDIDYEWHGHSTPVINYIVVHGKSSENNKH
ncbi:hypothetical protein [Jeotgalibacillus terrae]|uniref:DUF3221 domain-containing protein n=1 Tax=Jeotgalibacillus terrae TaxID=587735 RepID=A0ABW5ZP27_9BACL|nr:hypothetical protein [Jeotgalibacillus terrae]MBM7578161.1 hypothetical protein [Jeotgalibacillus terrae]